MACTPPAFKAKKIMKGITTFEIETDSTGILVSQKLDGNPVKETYALNNEHAEYIREGMVDMFWGFSRNTSLNQICCS